MSFVYVPTPPPPPSREAEELAGYISQVIDAYHKDHPELSPHDVRTALRLSQASRAPGNQAPLVAVALGLAVAMGLGIFVFGVANGGGGGVAEKGFPVMAIASAVLVLVALVFLIVKKRQG